MTRHDAPRLAVRGIRGHCWSVLYEFIVSHRVTIMDRARQRVRARSATKATEAKLEHGIQLFLRQLALALAPVGQGNALHLVNPGETTRSITDGAAVHGHELLRSGFSVAQLVHGYGDVCQVVTELANELNTTIAPEEFQLFNQCMDDAIAGAVTAYSRQRERDLAYEGTERLGVFAHELRNLLNTAVLSFDMIQRGLVGVSGSTGSMHSRSLSNLCTLVERSLAEVRLGAGLPVLENVSMLEFMQDIEAMARMQADGQGLNLTINPLEIDVAIDADRQLLASAVSNLLHNAFKFTRAKGHIALTTRATAERVQIEVSDECGGLPPGMADDLFRPFVQGSSDRSGLGLGLSIALSAAKANSGQLSVRDRPGEGCVFTIDLPRLVGAADLARARVT